MTLLAQLEQLRSQTNLHPEKVTLKLPGLVISVRSNNHDFLLELRDYFHSVITEQETSDLEVTAIQCPPFSEQVAPWQDWLREPGKTGRKDAFLNLEAPAQRLLYKVKTGMVFWQQPGHPTAFGDIETHPNQVINFILTQYLNDHLRQGWVLGHAAGLQIKKQGIAIAGLSGGGKSTLMLHLLEHGEHFISNDRLLFSPTGSQPICMRGIPKQPRINPGTIVHNPRLRHLIGEEKIQQLLHLPTEQLRALEEKYDADVDQLFGEGCYQPESPLTALVILNWGTSATTDTDLHTTTLTQSPELLPAIMKSPGPFYCEQSGHCLENGKQPEHQDYLAVLGEVPCHVLTGKIDFDKAVQLLIEQLQ